MSVFPLMGCGGSSPRPAARTFTFHSLASFDASTGSRPVSVVTIDRSGNLFGTAFTAGPGGRGAVWKIAAGTRTVQTVAAFTGTNGQNPAAGVTINDDGDIFGTASSGGVDNNGTLWKIAHGTNTIETIAAFSGADGAVPVCQVTLASNGDLFGTTGLGGAHALGTVWRVLAGTNTVEVIDTFAGPNGAEPEGRVTRDGSGNLFGTTVFGGDNGRGTVWKVPAGTNRIETITPFPDSANSTALAESSVVLDSQGNLFGTAQFGGANDQGMVWEIPVGSSTLRAVASFNGANGLLPTGDLVFDSDGDLFGTTQSGGANGKGTVWEIVAGTNSIKTLVSFDGANGSDPVAGVTLDGSGNLFGTTQTGGAHSVGTVFKLTLDD